MNGARNPSSDGRTHGRFVKADRWFAPPRRPQAAAVVELTTLGPRTRIFDLARSSCCARVLSSGQVAQLVEHRTENPSVGGSTPPLTTAAASRDVSLSPAIDKTCGGRRRPCNLRAVRHDSHLLPRFAVRTAPTSAPAELRPLHRRFPSPSRRPSFGASGPGVAGRAGHPRHPAGRVTGRGSIGRWSEPAWNAGPALGPS